jgi:hypothetical protein
MNTLDLAETVKAMVEEEVLATVTPLTNSHILQ